MIYTLPTSVDVNGHEYAVRSDFRAILDILEAVNDAELNDHERAAVLLKIFYSDFEDMPSDDYENAVRKCMWFINGGRDETPTVKPKKLVDWAQLSTVADLYLTVCQQMKERVDAVFADEVCRKAFGNITPGLDAFSEFFEKLSPFVLEYQENTRSKSIEPGLHRVVQSRLVSDDAELCRVGRKACLSTIERLDEGIATITVHIIIQISSSPPQKMQRRTHLGCAFT